MSVVLVVQQREEYQKNAAVSGFGLYAETAPVFIDDLGDDRESESHTVRFRGEKRVKDVFHVLFGNTRAAIENADFRNAVPHSRLGSDGRVGRRGLCRVQ